MTGILQTHIYNIGVTELQILSMILVVLPTNDNIYDLVNKELLFNLTLSELIVYIMVLL